MVYVKNTMLDRTANLLLPHYCCSCGEIGDVLCESCKNDIISEPFAQCLVCLQPTANDRGLCMRHIRLALGTSVVNWRRDSLEKLIDISKFGSMRTACRTQADLLAMILPRFDHDAAIVPVPTITKHIRQRGYGHAELIAREIARERGYTYIPALVRRTNFVQHGASKSERERQAQSAFALSQELDANTTYIVVDDVYTTGATVRAALKLLQSGGANKLWVAVTSRQPLG